MLTALRAWEILAGEVEPVSLFADNSKSGRRAQLVLAFAILVCSGSAQEARDYPQQAGRFDYPDAGDYTCLSIVDSVRTIGLEDRNPVPSRTPNEQALRPTGLHQVWVEEVKVVDSVSLKKGATIRVVVPATYPGIAFPFQAGKRYLVVATGQKDSFFVQPKMRAHSGITGEIARGTNEIFGFIAFETRANRLSQGESADWKIANSIADTLIGSSDASFRRTLAWLYGFQYPKDPNKAPDSGPRDFPFAQRLREIVSNSNAYRRAKVLQVLCRWQILGAANLYVHTLIEASADPSAWTASGDMFLNGDTTYDQPEPSVDPNYKGVLLTPEDWTNAILSAKSIPIRNYFISNFDYQTNDSQNRRLAVLLNDGNYGVQEQIVKHFARVLNVPEMGVVEGGAKERYVWKNREQSLTYWRDRLGVRRP